MSEFSLHLVFKFEFGKFYGSLDFPIDLFLFAFRASIKDHLLYVEDFLELLDNPGLIVRVDCCLHRKR